MLIIKKIDELRKIVKQKKIEGKIIGFVPTMGALHKGHLELIKKSKNSCACTIVSIFVNPIQFGPNEDFEKYPRDIDKDSKLAESAGADFIFNPDVEEIIGNDLLTLVDIKKMQDTLCGAKRPGHFQGVCTIVTKLFNIVEPDKAFFGKKDIQQLYIIKKMVKDLNFNIEIIPCETVREVDGLAMSSRNAYLNEKERQDALVLYDSLKEAKKSINLGETSGKQITEKLNSLIEKVDSAKIDYVKIVNDKMEDTDEIIKGNIIALAVFIGKTRLIDNYIIGETL